MKIPYPSWNDSSGDYKSKGPWTLTLTFKRVAKVGRSRCEASFTDQDGDRHTMLLSDASLFLPYLVGGTATGQFKIRKQGTGVGLTCVQGPLTRGVSFPTNDPALADALENVGYLEQANQLRGVS